LGPIILFDGACNLCEGSVQFVIRHDAAGIFQFASLQSSTGLRLRAEHKVAIDSVVLVEEGRAYVESEAAWRIAARLGIPWSWLRFLRFLPFRDAFYRLVARNRYRWFGRKDVCWLPSPELQRRFLE